MSAYTQTLIPDRVDFVPTPTQVGEYLASLNSLGAAPLTAAITVLKLSGQVRTITNPGTGKNESWPIRAAEKVRALAGIPSALVGANDYILNFDGKGPPKVPAFHFDFKGAYDFTIRCQLRPEVASTSNCHDETSIGRKVKFFGNPCSPKDRLGLFHSPHTGEVIEVPNAGCARFWIEFEFGKYLFPAIDDRLDIIEPSIVAATEEAFATKFVQGCYWCE